jgi:hypothetical protein
VSEKAPKSLQNKRKSSHAHLCVADCHMNLAWFQLISSLDAVQMVGVQRVEGVADPCASAELGIGRQMTASVNRRAEIVTILHRFVVRMLQEE